MPIRLLKTKAAFVGAISVDEADALQAWLGDNPKGRIDLGRCTHLHPASLQVLLAARVYPATLPEDPDFRAWLTPLFPAN